MRTLALLATCLVLGGGAPAGAQTFDEAVKANVALALQLCLEGRTGDGYIWAKSFRDAGFGGGVEDLGNDTTFRFSAPQDTASVELYFGQTPDYCAITSDHLGLRGAAEILDSVVPALHPDYRRFARPGGTDPRTGEPLECVRYEDPSNPIGHMVGMGPNGDVPGCTDNGTIRIYSSYRV